MGAVNIVFIILSVFILTGSVFMVQRGTKDFRAQEVIAPEVLSEQTDNTATPSPLPTPIPTILQTHRPSPKATAGNASPSTEISSFIYPGASVSSQSGSQVKMTSPDVPNTIMGWYNNKLNSMNMSNRKTNVKNNVNNGDDSYSAIITGSNDNLDISVEIKKSPSDSVASITVKIN